MIDNTSKDYAFIRSMILLLQSIGPLCTTFTALICGSAYWNRQWPEVTLIRMYFLAEALFFIFFIWFRAHLQNEAIHPPLQSAEDRKKFFYKIVSELHDPKKFLRGWFRGASLDSIGREEMKLFLNWAFWEGRAADDEDEELEEYTERVERLMGKKFKPGYGSAKSLRLTIDPIDMDYRSLLWYSCMLFLDTVTHIKMFFHGFTYYRTTHTSLAVFPPRPLTLTALNRSPAKRMSYWLRPHTSKTRLPVVYIHGIGIGLYPNVSFLHELDQSLNHNPDIKDDGKVGILAIEILQISSRLTSPILRRNEFLSQLTQVLDAHNFKKFVLSSHSYGSVAATHVLQHEPLASRVASMLFIDPVTILLHMPDVAYNFTARPPKHANEWQLWYFGSKDPGVAHTLGRHFFWGENLLWRDGIMDLVNSGKRMTASLASRDLIVDTETVGTYLTEHLIPDPVFKKDKDGRTEVEMQLPDNAKPVSWKHREWTGEGLEVIWHEGLDHAQVFDKKATRAKLVKVLVAYSDGK